METLGLELQIDEVNEKDYSFRATAVTTGQLRGRDFGLTMDGWELGNFVKNPVLLLNHDYDQLPIGRVADVQIEKDSMTFRPVFAVEERPDVVRPIWNLYTSKHRFMRAFSVGFEPLEVVNREDEEPPTLITRKELLEISAVSIGADPNALRESLCQACKCGVISNRQKRNLWRAITETLKVIPPHETKKAPEDTPWDAPTVIAKLKEKYGLDGDKPDWKGFARHFAYIAGAGDKMGDYKFPHHDEGMSVVWAACVNAMARLKQADVSAEDKAGIHRHIARHYQQFGKEVPELALNKLIVDFGTCLQQLEAMGAILDKEARKWK